MNVYLFLGIFLAADLLLVIYILLKRSSKKFSKSDLGFFSAEWQKIRSMSDRKHAIMDADKLLNVVLRKKNYQGNLGEQLQKAQKLFSDINGLWAAHKLRNRIAHELDVHISPDDRSNALRSFEKALKDLGAL